MATSNERRANVTEPFKAISSSYLNANSLRDRSDIIDCGLSNFMGRRSPRFYLARALEELSSMRHQNGYCRVTENVAGDPAQDVFTELAVLVGAHYQQAGPDLCAGVQDRPTDPVASLGPEQ